MSQIGPITVPEYAPTTTFPLTRLSYGIGVSQQPQVVTHTFGSANRKIQQRFALGNGSERITIGRRYITKQERESLLTFWESLGGPLKPFYFNQPQPDGTTKQVTAYFADTSLDFEALNDCLTSLSLNLVIVPTTIPSYTSAPRSTGSRRRP